jgi:hypothetical protein
MNNNYKSGDFITFENNIGIIDSINDNGTVELLCCVDREVTRFMPFGTNNIPLTVLAIANSKEEKILLEAIDEAGFVWDKSELKLKKKVVPKFEEGDKIRKKNSISGMVVTVYDVMDGYYNLNKGGYLPFESQEDYEIVSKRNSIRFNAYDKVIYKINDKWHADFFDRYMSETPYLMHYGAVYAGIDILPYEGNEELLNQ